MQKLAIVFAGQGSQYANMGLDYIEQNPFFETLTQEASHLLGYDVKEILASKQGELNDTLYTQPMILLTSIFGYETFMSLDVEVHATLGFSLGEYSALYASKTYSFKDIMALIRSRSQHMKSCASKYPGKMAAILGLSSDKVDEVCKESQTEGVVVSANYNSPVQTVISGEAQAVIKAVELAKAQGAKRAMMLNVSGAFHSPLMKEASDAFYQEIQAIHATEPHIPIYMNTTAKPLDFKQLKQEMAAQIISPVLFEQSISHMIADGITHFIEIGPGKVLSGLIQKINSEVHVTNLDRLSDLNEVKGWLKDHGFKK